MKRAWRGDDQEQPDDYQHADNTDRKAHCDAKAVDLLPCVPCWFCFQCQGCIPQIPLWRDRCSGVPVSIGVHFQWVVERNVLGQNSPALC